MIELTVEVCCQDAKGGLREGKEHWQGIGVRRGGRRPGGWWLRGAAKDLGDWGMRFKAREVLLREGIVLSLLLSQVGLLRCPSA